MTALADMELEALADALADRLVERLGRAPSKLVDAQTVADEFSLSRAWVYEHAGALGAVRVGDGPRARLRFDRNAVREHLKRADANRPELVQRPPRRRKAAPVKQRDLLPIRGRAA